MTEVSIKKPYRTYLLITFTLVIAGLKICRKLPKRAAFKKEFGMKLWSSKFQVKGKDANSDSGKMKSKILSFFDASAIGLGNSLGIGISVLIGGVIKNVAGPAIVISIFLAGLNALIGGLCSAEFGVQFLKTDSAYVYSYFWSREVVAFIYGWALILVHVVGTASAAKGIVTFTDELSDHKISDFLRNTTSTGFSDVFPYFDFISLGLVAVITAIVAFGIKDSLSIKKLFTVCNMALIVSIIISGSFNANAKNWQVEGEKLNEGSEEKLNRGFAPFGVLGVIKGAAIAFYGFIGLDTVCVSGKEIQKRKRNLPLVILVTTLIILGAYVGVGAVLSLMLLYEKLNPYAAVPFAFQQIGWISFKWIVIIMSFFGFYTSVFGVIFPLPKTIHAMANDGLLFNFLSEDHEKFKPSLMASMTGGLVAAGLAGIFPFQKLVNSAVIGALFVYIILAVSVILLRYSPKSEDDEKLSESWNNLLSTNEDVSVKAVMRNFFNFKGKHPTNLTKKIIGGNVVLFCISSIGISVIINVFYDSLVKCTTETIIPASVLLSVMFFNVLSITCQPKSQESVPFKVPLTPFLPCLSIFLNIFLMVTFESLTWILFSSWMGIGIILYFLWRSLKYSRGEVGKNSLYEINRTNAIKLNESIWKIKSDKKSFYEGAVNPVFLGDIEVKPNQVKNCKIQKLNEKTSFQLKQAEIIQAAESVAEERVEPLKNELELNFIRVNNAEIINTELESDEKVYWECVAEIHTEEEELQESEVLEIIDNFISETSEDLSIDDLNFRETLQETTLLEEKPFNKLKFTENTNFKKIGSKKNDTEPLNLRPESQKVSKYNGATNANDLEKHEQESFKEELLRKIELRMKNINYKNTISNNESSNGSKNIILDENKIDALKESFYEEKVLKGFTYELSNSAVGGINENKAKFLNFIIETLYEDHISEMNLNEIRTAPADLADLKSVPDERKKIKEFKEKLNQLLKNQINNNGTVFSNSFALQYVNADEEEKKSETGDEDDSVYNRIRTLNKSQIKDKLERLLAKGPPKKPSLESSFNLKIKNFNLNKDNESEKAKDEILNVQSSNISNDNKNKENSEKPSATLPDDVKVKTSFFSEVTAELPNEICC